MYKEIWEAPIGEASSDNNFVNVMQSAKSAEILVHEKFLIYSIFNSKAVGAGTAATAPAVPVFRP